MTLQEYVFHSLLSVKFSRLPFPRQMFVPVLLLLLLLHDDSLVRGGGGGVVARQYHVVSFAVTQCSLVPALIDTFCLPTVSAAASQHCSDDGGADVLTGLPVACDWRDVETGTHLRGSCGMRTTPPKDRKRKRYKLQKTRAQPHPRK
eukprot:GHVU01015715.1.p1 GENE.GHVU01015715.1~~GHVU01015715.1.p1  ORF type:complete len:147 (+),score=6.79 GHVU01015715.1:501-941(+)